MPQSLQCEPLKLSGGSVLTLPAGSTVPETSISVLNGSKAKIVKALIAGRRHHLEVVSSKSLAVTPVKPESCSMAICAGVPSWGASTG